MSFSSRMANPAAKKKLTTHFLPWLFVAVAVLFAGYVRLRLLSMPLERDEGEYAYAGQLILQGIPPYELAYNMKLPGTYFAYALGMGIFGQTICGVHLTVTLANALTIVFVFLLARKLFGAVAGIVSALGYAVMSVSPTVLGMAAHANHFVVLCAVPALLLLLIAEERKSARALFSSGLLFGLAFLMKQQGMVFSAFGGIFLLGRALFEKNIFTGKFVRWFLWFAGGFFLPFGIFCLACWFAGDFHEFWFWTFAYARHYAAGLSPSEGWGNLKNYWLLAKNVWEPLCLVAAAGFPVAVVQTKFRRPVLFAAGLAVFSFLGAAIGFYFRGHYFILILPAFAILVGAVIAAMQEAFSRAPKLADVFQSLPLILFAGILGWMIFYQAQLFFQLSPLQASRNLYQMNPNEESLAAGNYLRANSAPDAKIAVIGSEPEIYFYAHRHSATGYIYTYALMERQPLAAAMQRDMISEIETNQPEFLVFVPHQLSWLSRPDSSLEIFNWFKHYSANFYSETAAIGFDRQGNVRTLQAGDLEKTNELSELPLEIFKRK